MESTGAEASDVAGALWERMRARDWDGLAALFAEDAVVEWPVSGERIVRGTEHWTSPGSDPRPAWRAARTEAV
ncbi:hypothetical protein ACIGW0_08305 [Streptomyces bikiniensis]|uniref:SnoaL-like domain-containing protein n=1 Tax=Streptomyces bikiniensis TaxID=1896 RepID=A0ABW8CPA9_STRBI